MASTHKGGPSPQGSTLPDASAAAAGSSSVLGAVGPPQPGVDVAEGEAAYQLSYKAGVSLLCGSGLHRRGAATSSMTDTFIHAGGGAATPASGTTGASQVGDACMLQPAEHHAR